MKLHELKQSICNIGWDKIFHIVMFIFWKLYFFSAYVSHYILLFQMYYFPKFSFDAIIIRCIAFSKFVVYFLLICDVANFMTPAQEGEDRGHFPAWPSKGADYPSWSLTLIVNFPDLHFSTSHPPVRHFLPSSLYTFNTGIFCSVK